MDAQETDLLLTFESANGFSTSVSISLNSKLSCCGKMYSVPLRSLLRSISPTPDFVKFSSLPQCACFVEKTGSLGDEPYFSKADFETSVLYFGSPICSLRVELIYASDTKAESSFVNLPMTDFSEKQFDQKKCIRCDAKESCALLKIFSKSAPYLPWIRFLK